MKVKFLTLAAVVVLSACSVKQKVEKVSFKTPQDTFDTWVQASRKLDLEKLAECYSRTSQDSLRNDVSRTTEEALNEMRDESQRTKFTIEKIVYEGTQALLRVRRDIGSDSEIEILNMVKEGDQWKLVP